jgi:uncharacterized membrane-anchored protein YhcB (DUF1043 family)
MMHAAEKTSICDTLAQVHADLKKHVATDSEELAASQRNTANQQKVAALEKSVAHLQAQLVVTSPSQVKACGHQESDLQ